MGLGRTRPSVCLLCGPQFTLGRFNHPWYGGHCDKRPTGGKPDHILPEHHALSQPAGCLRQLDVPFSRRKRNPDNGPDFCDVFNQHLFTAEQGLNDALTLFKQQGVSELVLDMRYNTGGYLMVAEEVSSMIGGAPVQGKVFEKLLFNSKHPEKTNDPNNTFLFGSQDSKGTSLPLLGLNRVFVLTGSNTCSASEAIINGLQPYVQVVRIGWTTCGKPYGFIQTNNDQQAYFAIQF